MLKKNLSQQMNKSFILCLCNQTKILFLQTRIASSHGKSIQRRIDPCGHFATYFEDSILHLRKRV